MSTTYKTDDSFFTIIAPQMSVYYAWPLHEWLTKNEVARLRLIQDYEIESGRLNLKEVHELYPGISTIGVVMNPWARFIYRYIKILEYDPDTLSSIDISIKETIETGKVARNLNRLLAKISEDQNWCFCDFLKPQMNWLSYNFNNGCRTQVEYIVRGEYAAEDTQPLIDYFCLTDHEPFNFNFPTLDYYPYYTDEIKNFVAKLHATDIKTFGYKF